jgi:hypothetical protein
MLGRKELPLTLVVLDEVQQFIRQDPGLTLKIQTIAERLAGRFDGRLLLVATGQQALSDVQNLQKLLDRFPVHIARAKVFELKRAHWSDERIAQHVRPDPLGHRGGLACAGPQAHMLSIDRVQ